MRDDGITGEDGELGRIARLYHRRRGWAWVGFGSLIGAVVYLIIGFMLFLNVTGAAEVAIDVPLFALPVLAVVGLIAAIIDTVRLRRFDKVARDAARQRVTHHPVYAHAHRFPPKHLGTWALSFLLLLLLPLAVVPLLPQEVNGAAYLLGVERQATFEPVDYVQLCGRNSCDTGTAGYLSGSGAEVTLGRKIPLDTTVQVRVPLWDWGTGHNILDSTGDAVGMLVIGLVFNALALLFLAGLVTFARVMRFVSRSKRTAGATSAGSGGTPQHSAPPGRSSVQSRHGRWEPMPPVGSNIGVKHGDQTQ